MVMFPSRSIGPSIDDATGLLHKKGIAFLQPHEYVSVAADRLRFRGIFEIIHGQHVRNSAFLLAALAMLTDELVRMDPCDPNEMVFDPETDESAIFLDEVSKLRAAAFADALDLATKQSAAGSDRTPGSGPFSG
jgi:hypothetical protein